MRNRLFAWGIVVLAVSGVLAQGAAPTAQPVATLRLQDGHHLAYVSGGEFLVVADGTSLELYDVRDASAPLDRALLPLDSAASALAAASDYVLAAVTVPEWGDEVWVVAPDRYSPGGFGVLNYLPSPGQTREIIISPDNRWALVVGDVAYMTLAMGSASEIESSAPIETSDAAIVAAALSNDQALIVREGQTDVETLGLTTNFYAQSVDARLTLEAPGTAIAVNDASTLGAVALVDNRLTLFDAQTLAVLNTITLEDGPVQQLRFVEQEGRQILLLMIQDRSAVMLLDVTNPADVSLPGSVGVNGAVQGIDSAGSRFAVETAVEVVLFEVNAP